MGLFPVLLFAAVHTVTEDRIPLRDACEAAAGVVGEVRRGDNVEVKFALSGEIGTCYKVAVTSNGNTRSGYLPASAMKGFEQFEQARQSAATFDASQSPVAAPPPPRPASGPPSAPAGANINLNEAAAKASTLLAGNQPQQALETIEPALRKSPSDPNLLALAGIAALQSDRPQDAIDYLRRSLDIAPNPKVQRLLEKATREAKADQSAQKLVGIRFNFRYDDKQVTPDQARLLVPILDAEYLRVSQYIGCEAGERITAIIQSQADYLRTTGAAEWSGGQFDGRIRVAMFEPQPGERTRRAFAHEIVHACLARTGNWPAWLHEGLAQKLSGETLAPADRAQVRKMAQSKELPSLGKMGLTWSRLSSRHAQIAYSAALAAADLLFDHYGSAGVRSLLQSPGMLPQITADLDQRLRQ